MLREFLDFIRAYPDLLELSGVVGSILYVGGFALVQGGVVCGNGKTYALSKIFAALFVLLSLAGAFNLGAFLIQIGFISFGLWGLVRRVEIKDTVPIVRIPENPIKV
ncbi:CBU_0592 family membrane protein [Actibacterium lipolyticum]|uniref:CBU-0592-like domain-containing protein n=1 Tax=Actibacterium lipolyticum TaxID=1524263 RepID=A0A238JY82_9RHOB|nr:hypothetical protein [Actibacterium lipolyticum]SMX34666.1 hypothetical protein COL8621_01427 [Actibacterium lipolyticum]